MAGAFGAQRRDPLVAAAADPAAHPDREDPRSDVLQLPRYAGNIISTIDVLAAAGLLIEDRPTRLKNYFNTKTSTLPPVMKQQLEVWLQVMTKGATTAPRQRARDPQTVRLHILGIAPIIAAWAEAGHQSLAEITPEQVRQALPEKGSHRHFAALGLRSLFKTIKARKLVFADPTRGMKASPVATNVPLSLDTAAIRGELNSPDPVIALAVALVAFHALTGKQVRELRLTDIVDGRMILGDRAIPLAAPVRTRLSAWLDHRNRTWPGSACLSPTRHRSATVVAGRPGQRRSGVGARHRLGTRASHWRGLVLRRQQPGHELHGQPHPRADHSAPASDPVERSACEAFALARIAARAVASAHYSLISCSRRMSACPQCCASSRSMCRYTQRSGSGPRRLPWTVSSSPSDEVARRDDSHASRWARWTVAMVSSSSMM